jgi:DNA-binding IclR family transcriptional regulator
MLLRNLREMGYLEYEPTSRTFTPSIRVALLGSWIDQRFGAAGALGKRLAALHSRVGHTAYIAIQNGPSAQYVMSKESRAPDRLDVSSGGYRSLTFSAPGRALLSLAPTADILSWVRRCNAEAESERWRVRERDFLELMQTVRAQGFATTAGDVTPGLGAIATTFKSPMSRTPLAVGVGGPTAQIVAGREVIIEALRAFVAEGVETPSPTPRPTATVREPRRVAA